MKFKRKNLSRAFSFVEVMVAVFLVSVGLLAALKLLTGGLSATMDSRDQLIASLLAQEGTELVRSVRDNNWANGKPSFNGGTAATTIGNGSWRINYNYTTTTALNDVSANPLRYRLLRSFSFYTHSGTSSTQFFRKIIISGDSNQKKVLSLVVWNGKSAGNPFVDKDSNALTENNLEKCNTENKCAYAEDVLTNWGE